ncbi:MAG: 16S rRNA (uracil(1498)-N(3))-methyltransferase [Melioribacteraceae bacterium]|nr:16S rRNA (uracil(1498)-N(3))-methyltransferase [Melioribacteraceae bacterium]
MNIIILTKKDCQSDNIYKISDNRFTHIKNILKSEIGDILEIGLLNGKIGTARITDKNESEVLLEIINLDTNKIISPKIDIICALPRPQTLKKVLNTCATMGVNNLHLIRSEKVEKSYFHSPLLERENYTKYLIEGLEQGKRTNLPKVAIHHKFKVFFENNYIENDGNYLKLLAQPNVDNYLTKDVFTDSDNIVLAIGPESGWNEFEINFMAERGFKKFKLSEYILRVETAVTASLAQIELLLNS